MSKLIPTIVIAVLMAGCSSTPVKESPKAEQPRVVQPKTVAEPVKPVQPAPKIEPKIAVQPVEKPRIVPDPLNDPNSPLAKRSIYYDFDSSEIKDEFKSLIRAHAGYLVSKRTAKIRVEGNCDERGSREYNLALGQKRAESVKVALVLLGVAEGQIETVSWGEEKPKAMGHDESTWAENRRSDIVYQKVP